MIQSRVWCMWQYSQTTGALTRDGVPIGKGYSGNGDGLNNPAMQGVSAMGPLPRGTYTIGPPFVDPGKGPVVMRLTPNPVAEQFGRSGFLIHGDNAAMNHTASHGCIILARPLREQVAASGDRDLTVTA